MARRHLVTLWDPTRGPDVMQMHRLCHTSPRCCRSLPLAVRGRHCWVRLWAQFDTEQAGIGSLIWRGRSSPLQLAKGSWQFAVNGGLGEGCCGVGAEANRLGLALVDHDGNRIADENIAHDCVRDDRVRSSSIFRACSVRAMNHSCSRTDILRTYKSTLHLRALVHC